MERLSPDTLLRLRRRELDVVERVFSDVLKRGEDAASALKQAEQSLLEQERRACDPNADDAVVEAFSRWLPTGRRAIEKARFQERQVAIDRDMARSALMMAQDALRNLQRAMEGRGILPREF